MHSKHNCLEICKKVAGRALLFMFSFYVMHLFNYQTLIGIKYIFPTYGYIALSVKVAFSTIRQIPFQ